VARERAQNLGAELDAVAVATLARAALGRSAAVEALVRDHAALAARGAGAHEQRSHLLLKGQVALAAGEPRQAIEFLEQTADLLEAPLRCCTNHALVWSALGRAHLELGDRGEAERWFRKVTELGDARVAAPIEFIRSFYFLGKVQAAGGNEAGARESYARFLSYWEDGDIDRERVAEARAYLDGA
jgi:tetratricopeptide (TPR) repeat protein